MTVALGVLSGVLAVAVAVLALVHTRIAGQLKTRIAGLENSQSALASGLEDARTETAAAERHLASNLATVGSAQRIRAAREWRELAGPSDPLPPRWDGTLGAAMAVELQIIREVVGTPSTLDAVAGGGPDAAFRMAMCAEFLRAAARDSDEMKVLVDDEVLVWASTGTPGFSASTPHLDAMQADAADGGALVVVEPAEGGFKATLRFAAPDGPGRDWRSDATRQE